MWKWNIHLLYILCHSVIVFVHPHWSYWTLSVKKTPHLSEQNRLSQLYCLFSENAFCASKADFMSFGHQDKTTVLMVFLLISQRMPIECNFFLNIEFENIWLSVVWVIKTTTGNFVFLRTAFCHDLKNNHVVFYFLVFTSGFCWSIWKHCCGRHANYSFL